MWKNVSQQNSTETSIHWTTCTWYIFVEMELWQQSHIFYLCFKPKRILIHYICNNFSYFSYFYLTQFRCCMQLHEYFQWIHVYIMRMCGDIVKESYSVHGRRTNKTWINMKWLFVVQCFSSPERNIQRGWEDPIVKVLTIEMAFILIHFLFVVSID